MQCMCIWLKETTRDQRSFGGISSLDIMRPDNVFNLYKTMKRGEKKKFQAKFIGGREKNKNKVKFLPKYISSRDKNKNKI